MKSVRARPARLPLALIGMVALLASTAACAEGHAPAPSPDPSGAPPVALRSDGIGSVRFGTPAAVATRRLVRLLGPTSSRVTGGCDLGGPGDKEHARTLTWDGLSAIISDRSPDGSRRVDAALKSWQVTRGALPPLTTLPHGITIGAPAERVRNATIIWSESTDLDGNLLLQGQDRVTYDFDAPGDRGRVVTISVNVSFCE